MFKVEEYIIYKRDLCKIKRIEKNSKTNEEYYVLSLVQDPPLLIKVPTSNKLGHLRYPLSKAEAEDLIEKIPTIPCIEPTEKLSENIYRSLMKTNIPKDLIKIIKTTYLRNLERLNNGKKLGDKDLVFFEQSEKLLYTELGYSLNMTYDECKNYIIKKISEQQKEKD